MKRILPKSVPGESLSSSSARVSNPNKPYTSHRNLQNSAHVDAVAEVKRLRKVEASVLRDLEEGKKALDNTKGLVKACHRKVEGLENKAKTLVSSLEALYEETKRLQSEDQAAAGATPA